MTMSQIIEEEVPGANVVVLSGPSHAEEVGRGLPTTIVVGAHDRESALYVQNVFMSPVFRVYTSPDITGIELGGALKMSSHWQPERRMVLATATIRKRL